jgi:hypothetical protein
MRLPVAALILLVMATLALAGAIVGGTVRPVDAAPTVL